MSLNLVPIAEKGIKNALNNMSLVLLKLKKHADKNGQVDRVNATLAVAKDNNSYVKANGEEVKDVNLGETFTVKISNPKLQSVRGVVMNVRLINPTVHAIYATTTNDSSFATINISIAADDIQLPSTPAANQQFEHRDKGSK